MSDDQYGQSKSFDALNTRGLAGKRDYVRSLVQRRDEEALSLLVECLCDESWYLRELAEGALLRLGEPAAQALQPLLDQGLWYSRASAARVLGRMGYTAAVPGLLRLCEDSVESVAKSAHAALVDLGHRGGSVRIAWELHRLPADARRRLRDSLSALDRPLGERLERMLRNDELMSTDAPQELRDDSPFVRASEEGVEWEVLTGPPQGRTGEPATPGTPIS